jgi:hypothetical protein
MYYIRSRYVAERDCGEKAQTRERTCVRPPALLHLALYSSQPFEKNVAPTQTRMAYSYSNQAAQRPLGYSPLTLFTPPLRTMLHAHCRDTGGSELFDLDCPTMMILSD